MNGRTLTLVACGAPLAARTSDLRDALAGRWSVSVVVTEAALGWTVGSSVPHRPRPDRVVVCPLTFNTANKMVAGVMDTPASGILCDALGSGMPVIAVPMVNDRLWAHPAWPHTLRTLEGAGVTLIDPRTGRIGAVRPVESGSGAAVVAAFRPAWVVEALDDPQQGAGRR